MKPSPRALLAVLAVLAAVGIAAPARAACPYDILALCCIATNSNGGCAQWKNCCDLVLSSGEDDDDDAASGGAPMGLVSLVASPACVRGCDTCQDPGAPGEGPPPVDVFQRRLQGVCGPCAGLPSRQRCNKVPGCTWTGPTGSKQCCLDDATPPPTAPPPTPPPPTPPPPTPPPSVPPAKTFASLSACYETCAEPPNSDAGCNVVASTPTGFGAGDQCCTQITLPQRSPDDRRLQAFPSCDEWQDCRLVRRRPTRYNYFLPFASGECIKQVVRSDDNECTSLYECYEFCSGVNLEEDGYQGPFNFGGADSFQGPCLGVPSLYGHATAYVPVVNTINFPPVDFCIFALATDDGNLDMNVNVGMCCPGDAGQLVLIRVFVEEGPVVAGGTSPYGETVSVRPFSVEDLDDACSAAWGGGFSCNESPGGQTRTTAIQKTVKIEGQCSGNGETVTRFYQVSLDVTCDNINYFPPVE